MLRLWLHGARRLGARERALVAVLLLSLLIFLNLHRTLSPTLSEDKEPFASFRLSAFTQDDNKVVPRILHQTWSKEEIPEIVKPWVESWLKLNPGWQYWFWTDQDMRKFVEVKFPQYLKLYDSYPSQAYRNDAFRYFALYHYGGIYADMDMECLHPLEPILDTTDCLVSQEPLEHAHFLSTMGPPLVSNALMACRPGHPFFKHLITDLPSYSGFWHWKAVLYATGPNMLTEVYRGYQRGWFGWSKPSNPVHLANPEQFHPAPDESMVESMREMCMFSQGKDLLSDKYSRRQAELCEKLKKYDYNAKPPKDSYTLHHWTHMWAGKINDPFSIHSKSSRTFNIQELKFTPR